MVAQVGSPQSMTATTETITAALSQIKQGFAVFALGKGKTPVTSRGFKDATTDPKWAEKQLLGPRAGNYGMTWPVGDVVVVVFDLDNGADGKAEPWIDRLAALKEKMGDLPPTKHTLTPSGGFHMFYRWPAGTPVPGGDTLFGFTVRWPGKHYVVGPGSVIDGKVYEER